MTRPVCWSKSCRLTPRMYVRWPLIRRSRPRISTRRKPIRSEARSATVPSGDRSVTTTDESAGTSADHGVTFAISTCQWTVPFLRRLEPAIERGPGGRVVLRALGTADRVAAHERHLGRLERVVRPVLARRLLRQRVGQAGKRGLHGPASLPRDAGETDLDGQLERAGRQVVREPADRLDVGEMDRLRHVQEDRPRDAAVPPLVLVLDVGGVRPLHHPQRERVVTRLEPVGDLELGCEVGVLADPDLDPVERRDQDALGGPHVEHHPATRPLIGDPEGPLVETGRVRLGDLRRPAREGHLDVGVVGLVGRVLHRPAARDLDVPPLPAGFRVGPRQELEAPGTVEVHAVGVRDAVHGESTDAGQFGRRPRLRHKRDCRTSGGPARVRACRPQRFEATAGSGWCVVTAPGRRRRR